MCSPGTHTSSTQSCKECDEERVKKNLQDLLGFLRENNQCSSTKAAIKNQLEALQLRNTTLDGENRPEFEATTCLHEELLHLRKCLLSLQAPIRRLPSDILLEVFQLLADKPSQLLHLTWVCSYWRSVALACPVLWSNIIIGYGYSGLKPVSELSFTELCLCRSGTSLLAITSRSSMQEEYLIPLIKLLVENVKRWESFAFPYCGSEQIRSLLRDGLEGAINLKSLLWDGDASLKWPWEQLTSFEHWSGDPSNTLSILSRTINLQRLCLVPPLRELENHNNKEDLYQLGLPNLTCLGMIISKISKSSLENILMQMRAPCLTHLEVNMVSSSPTFTFPTRTFERFICQSQCQVLSLTLNHVTVDIEELVSILKLTPDLVCFRVQERFFVSEDRQVITRRLLDRLHIHDEDQNHRSNLLPCLTTIEVVLFDFYALGEDELVFPTTHFCNLIKNRVRRGLKTVKLANRRETATFSCHDMAAFRELASQCGPSFDFWVKGEYLGLVDD